MKPCGSQLLSAFLGKTEGADAEPVVSLAEFLCDVMQHMAECGKQVMLIFVWSVLFQEFSLFFVNHELWWIRRQQK